jgi:nucleotide-binding universal stress UspA family protein
MAKPTLEPGDVLDGFVMERLIHRGGMSRLWSVNKPGIDMPLLMKVPVLGEGQDPAAIVSFEMEQMIMPRISGLHVPQFVAAGDFAVHPYIVMERLAGKALLQRLPDLPLPYEEVAQIGWKIATALADIHRQHVIHLDLKPSNVLFRPTGEAVLIDFGLSHHTQLPDLMQEEFRLPYGTAPYMAPEQLLGARHDPRTDQFALGVLLYFFSTGERPFGESERLSAMKRRLWEDPKPPRRLREDYPIWLQEIVLRCLEVEPAWRYPSMAQLAFELSHHDQIKLTARSERMNVDSFWARVRRRFNTDPKVPHAPRIVALPLPSAPIIAVAVDTGEGSKETNDALRESAARALTLLPSARLACVNVLKQSYIATRDTVLDAEGHNKHVNRLVALKAWAQPLKLGEGRITYHVLEAIDPASAILTYAEQNRVDQILIGARQHSLWRSILGSVSVRVASEASCTVTVVRPPRKEGLERGEPIKEEPPAEKAESS